MGSLRYRSLAPRAGRKSTEADNQDRHVHNAPLGRWQKDHSVAPQLTASGSQHPAPTSDATGLMSPHGKLDPISRIEFAHQAGQMGLDGAGTDV